eukprot:scaffold148861_cov28-Tisochrysis_lutea.AAC.8
MRQRVVRLVGHPYENKCNRRPVCDRGPRIACARLCWKLAAMSDSHSRSRRGSRGVLRPDDLPLSLPRACPKQRCRAPQQHLHHRTQGLALPR